MTRNSTLLVTLFLAGVCNAGESLCFHFKPGDKFSLVAVNEQKTVRSLAPKGQDARADSSEAASQQTLRLECNFDVEEVETDGCAWAKYTYRRVALKVSSPRGEAEGEKDVDIDYDSDASRQSRRAGVPPQALPFHLALGESFFVRITPQGRITNVNGLSAVVGNAKSKIPNIAIKDQLIRVIDRQFDEAAIKRELQSQFAVFPDADSGPISVGDVWSRRQQSGDGKISLEWTFRLKERSGGVAVVDANVSIASDANTDPIFIGEIKAKSEVSGQGGGQIEIEQSTGRIINSALTQDIVEKVTFLPEGAIRRPPPAPAPIRTHTVTTFQMINRDSDSQPSPADANQPA